MIPIKVMVVDDHRIFRQGLISLMKTRPDTLEVVGEAGNGAEALTKARCLKPDIILMDLYMPGCNGLEATRLIRQELPKTCVIMLTASDTDEDLCEAVRNGAMGYLVKSMDAEEIFDLILGAVNGQIVMTRLMGTRLVRALERRAITQAEGPVCLTEREAQVLDLLAQGLSNPRIAAALSVSLNTVKTHVSHILHKLSVQTRAEVVKYALQHGLARSN